LSGFGRQLLAALYEELCALEQRIEKMEEQVQQIHRSNTLCQKVAAVEGIGPVTATAVIAAIADGRTFHNGRQFAAWTGLVPCNIPAATSSGTSESPSEAIHTWRMLLIHGARSVVYRTPNKKDSPSQWIAEKQRKQERAGDLGPCWRVMKRTAPPARRKKKSF